MKNNTRYGNWSNRLGLLFMGACGFGTFYFMVILAIQRTLEWHNIGPGMLVASVPFGLFGLVVGFLCLYGIVETFSVYRLDAGGIEKRSLFGSGRMGWDYVTDLKVSGNKDNEIVLTDSLGNRLRILLALMPTAQRREISAQVHERLAGLLEKRREAMAWEVRTYRPTRNVSWILLPVILLFFGFGLMPWISGSMMQGTEGEKWSLLLLCGGIGVVCTVLFTCLYTWRLIISQDAITSERLYHSRTIPFDQITSVMIRDVSTRNGTTNVTTIEGAGQKIYFSETMPDYTLVRDYIQSRAGKAAVERGAAAVPSLKKKQLKQGLVFMTLICVFGLGGMSLYFMQNALGRLARQDQLDARGVRTAGSLERKYTTGNKSTSYVIAYTFTVNGHTYRHESPVPREVYNSAIAGQSVPLVYLPEDPDIARAAQSIGRKEAEGALHYSWFLLAFSLGLPPLFYLQVRGRLHSLEMQSPVEPASSS